VKDALALCDYFSFDCEMTGINLNDTNGSPNGGGDNGKAPMFLDDIEDRYSEVRRSGNLTHLCSEGW
jgi:hypothetical protein